MKLYVAITCNIYETGTTFSTNNINKAKFIESYEKD